MYSHGRVLRRRSGPRAQHCRVRGRGDRPARYAQRRWFWVRGTYWCAGALELDLLVQRAERHESRPGSDRHDHADPCGITRGAPGHGGCCRAVRTRRTRRLRKALPTRSAAALRGGRFALRQERICHSSTRDEAERPVHHRRPVARRLPERRRPPGRAHAEPRPRWPQAACRSGAISRRRRRAGRAGRRSTPACT